MQLETNSLIDVTEYEHIIRQEAWRRYINNQRTGIEGMTNPTKARIQHTRGAAAEVAARLSLGVNPYGILEDEIGNADIEHRGVLYDVKCITAEYPILHIQYYEGVLDKRQDWIIMVMMYEGIGWRFINHREMSYNDLRFIDPVPASGGHRSAKWRLDMGTK